MGAISIILIDGEQTIWRKALLNRVSQISSPIEHRIGSRLQFKITIRYVTLGSS